MNIGSINSDTSDKKDGSLAEAEEELLQMEESILSSGPPPSQLALDVRPHRRADPMVTQSFLSDKSAGYTYF